MNTTTNNKKVSVKEEVSPEMGLTEAEIKAGIWNSPPAQKGQGRYLILGKTITPADFAALKSAEKVTYWSEDFLEECDMFFTSPGWRIHADGLSILRRGGYEIEIDTIEAQKKRAEEGAAKKKAEAEAKDIVRKAAEEKYAKEIAEIETLLGNPKWDGKADVANAESNVLPKAVHIKHIAKEGSELYTDYGITRAGYVHAFQHINSDWWNDSYSESQAPAHIIAEAQKIIAEQEAETKRKAAEWEEEKKHRPYVHFSCPRCNREVYILKSKTDKPVRCGKCHTGKKATEATTVEMERKEEVEFQHIPAGAETL